MGQTGETYLVGADKRMRSDSFLDPEGHSVQASFAGTVKRNGVDTVAARKAIDGQTGAEVVMDYNGNPVLSAYMPVEIGSHSWALLAEIDEAEVMQPIQALQRNILLICLVLAAAIVAALLFGGSVLTIDMAHYNRFYTLHGLTVLALALVVYRMTAMLAAAPSTSPAATRSSRL